MDLDKQILAQLQLMNRTIQSSGSMGAGSDARSRGDADPPETAEAKKRMRLQQSIAEKIQRNMKKSSNQYVRSLAKSASSYDKIKELQSKHTSKNIEEFVELRKQYRAGQVDLKTYRDRIKNLGFTTRDLRKSEAELSNDFEQLHNTVGNLDDRMDQAAERGGRLKKAFAALGAIVTAVGTELYKVHTTSMRIGIEETYQQAINARMMGMSQVDLLETMAQYRRTIESSNMSTDRFQELMKESSVALFTFTGDLTAGAKFAADSLTAFRDLGASGMTAVGFMDQQVNIFKDLHNTLSITADQFKLMNEQLIQSSAVRAQLFKMDRQRRSDYFIELQNVQKKLLLDGLTIEQTQKVIETMEQLGGQSPRARLKQAAKLQAMLGGIGMGGIGTEAADLLRGGLRQPGDKQRFTQLMTQATQGVSSKMGGGFASEMMMSQLLETTGLGDLFGPTGAFADIELQKGQAVAKTITNEQGNLITKNTAETAANVKDLAMTTQRVSNAWKEGPIATIVSSLGVIAGAFATGGLMRNLLGRAGLGGMLKNIKGNIGQLLGVNSSRLGMLTRGLGAVGIAGAIGYGAGTIINESWRKYAPESHRQMTDIVGGTLAQILDTSFKETLDSTMSFWGRAIKTFFGGDITEDETKQRLETRTKQRDERLRRAGLLKDQTDKLERIAKAVEKNNELVQQQTSVVDRKTSEQIEQQSMTLQEQRLDRRHNRIRSPNRAGRARTN